MTEILHCGTRGLADDQRLIVSDRSQILLPYLKVGVTQVQTAREQKLIRTYFTAGLPTTPDSGREGAASS